MSKYELQLSTGGDSATVDVPDDMTDQEIAAVNRMSVLAGEAFDAPYVIVSRVKPEREPCEVFAWIGQSFACCDDCGEPYWDHAREYVVGRRFQGEPETREIPPERALAVRRKWDPSFVEESR